MSYTAEIKNGSVAERFRAYANAPMTRRPGVADHRAMALLGREFKPGQMVSYTVHEPIIQGDVSGSKVSIDSGAAISHVVFYAGPVESEVVVGSVQIGSPGLIEIDLVEEPSDAPEPIPAEDLTGA